MANNWYPVSDLTGGSDGALDAIDGDGLNDGDRAIAIIDENIYCYILDGSSSATENSPHIISPDANPGTKRWILATSPARVITLETTSATPGTITLVVSESKSWAFKITVSARQSAGAAGTVGDTAFWNITGGIKRDDSDNTALVGTPQGHGTPGANDRDAGAAAWDLTITADDTNEYLTLTATGEASKTIQWTAKVELIEAG